MTQKRKPNVQQLDPKTANTRKAMISEIIKKKPKDKTENKSDT